MQVLSTAFTQTYLLSNPFNLDSISQFLDFQHDLLKQLAWPPNCKQQNANTLPFQTPLLPLL